MSSFFNKKQNGDLINIIVAQVDIVGHSGLTSDPKSLQVAKEILHLHCKQISENFGGEQLSWAGDGGSFIFPVVSGTSFEEAILAIWQILYSLPSINLEISLKTDLQNDIAIRLSCDTGNVHWNKDRTLIHGEFLNAFFKYERAIGMDNCITLTERVWKNLSKKSKELFRIRRNSPELGVQLYAYAETRPNGWRLGAQDRKIAFQNLIKRAPDNSILRFISVTAASDLTATSEFGLPSHIREAFGKGNKFFGVVLDPNSIEARCRGTVESPGIIPSLLSKDADIVRFSLGSPGYEGKPLQIRYSSIGLPFKLWMSETEALVEPLHLGKSSVTQFDNGLCGFTLLHYKQNDPEYAILSTHFEALWKFSSPFCPITTFNAQVIFQRVELEINTECNRKPACTYCPNSIPDIINSKPNGLMSEELFDKIIKELSTLMFAGRLSFQFYGEPLLHPNLDDFIVRARQSLPKSQLALYTNGDFLDEERYNNLVKSGIDVIVISNPEVTPAPRNKQVILSDYHLDNRGGILGSIQTLSLPCYAPSSRLLITFDGEVLLCYEDAKRGTKFGNVNNKSILEIWNSDKFQKVRRDLERGKRDLYLPCRNCDNQAHSRFGQINVNML